MPERLVNNIRTLRFLHGEMTQADLGQRVGVTRQTIAAIEQGRYAPSLETGLRIARVFGKPVEEIFRWEDFDEA
jgi:putative transcriptional regulator